MRKRGNISRYTAEELAAKEAVSLVDNNAFSTAIASLAIHDLERLLDAFDAAAALDVSLETKADLDVGAMAVWGPLRLGVSAKHLGKPGFGSGAGRLELERQARAGLAWVVGQPGAATVLTAALDADLTRTPTAFGDARHVAAGLEASMPRSRLALRGGVSTNTAGQGGTSASAGISLRLTKEAVYLDGATTFGSDRSRRGWAVGLRLTI